MIETVVKVDGMMCGMCESHVNDAVRKAFPEAKKVASSTPSPDGDPLGTGSGRGKAAGCHQRHRLRSQGRIECTVREKRFFLVFEKINPETIS